MILRDLILLAVFFAGIFIIGEVLHRVWKWRPENSRKVVHICTGLLALSFPYFFDQVWPVLLLCGIFLLILIFSLVFGFLPSINAVKRKTRGSILFPIIVALCFWVSTGFDDALYFYLPILIMAICDPLAALAGNASIENQKSWAGFRVFFFSSFFLSVIFLWHRDTEVPLIVVFALLLATTTSLAEFYSKKGWDNFSIPVTAVATIFFIEKLNG